MSPVSTLRRVPTPAVEPPYDDEFAPLRRRRASTGPVIVQGTLALAFTLPSGLPAVPQPPLRLATTPADDEPEHAAANTPRRPVPDPLRWASKFVQALVEVVAGNRPATQLVRWTTTGVYAEVRAATRAYWWGNTPARSGQAGAGADARVAVRSIHVSQPREDAAEVCAVVQRGSRVAAIALRLDFQDGRWQCTALELG